MRKALFPLLLMLTTGLFAAPSLPEHTLEETEKMDLNLLAIENGKIVAVTEVRNGEYLSPEGYFIDHLAPMTIVRVDLFPSPKSHIRCEIVLPEEWNGRFLGMGSGGAAGRLRSEARYASQIHCAVAHCDLGTSPLPYEAGCGNPEVWKDFGWRATHLMTLAAKQLIRAKYGKDPDFCYFSGESTGGEQALSEAQRFPEDYDGIIAGVPAHCRCPLHAYFLWCYQQTRTADGSPLFTERQMECWTQTVLTYFAGREKFPHAKNAFISDPRWTPEDRRAVLELSAKNDPTLSPAHLTALKNLMEGPRNSRTGERIFNGILPGAPFPENGYGNLYLFKWFFGRDVDYRQINFDTDIDRYLTEMGKELNAENPDLSAFEKRGGKLIVYSGTSDPMVPYHATLDYYERVIEHFGSLEKVRGFFRYYLLPGRAHSDQQGAGVRQLQDQLDALIAWREKGIVPQMFGVRCGEGGYKLSIAAYPDGTCRGGVERIAERYLK